MKKKIYLIFFFSFLIILSLNSPCLHSENSSSEITKISETKYKIGKAYLDTEKGSVTLNGWVNMSEGLVELLACGPNGKRHESVLVIDVEPYHLQVALLMLGLEPGGGLLFQGDPRTPTGDSLYVYVSWDECDGDHIHVRGEDLIYNVIEKRTMTHTAWIFSGSRFVNGRFVAAIEQSYITTFHDPNTIIDNPLPTGADDTLYEVNKNIVPAENTPVTVELIKQ